MSAHGIPITIHLSRAAWAAWNAEADRLGIRVDQALAKAAERSARPATPVGEFLADRTQRYADDPDYRRRLKAERPRGRR